MTGNYVADAVRKSNRIKGDGNNDGSKNCIMCYFMCGKLFRY